MKKFFLSEILYGLILTLLVAFFYIQPGSFLETLELKFYDFRSGLRQPASPSKNIALVTIDEDSIAKIGRWPWPRWRIAQLLELLSQPEYKPKVIGLNVLFSEPEQNQGLGEIGQLKESLKTALTSREEQTKKLKPKFAAAAWPLRQGLKWWEDSLKEDKKFLESLEASFTALDNDTKLEAAISTAASVVLPLSFQTGSNIEGKPSELPEALSKSALTVNRSLAGDGGSGLLSSFQAIIPLERFAKYALGAGHVNTQADTDGTIRREPLGISYGDQVYPSFALEAVRHYLGLPNEDASIEPGQNVLLGATQIPTDENGGFALTFCGPERTFPYYSFFDVVERKVAPEALKDKIVLVGLTAAGLGTVYTTPLGTNFPGVEIVATVIDNILHKRFLVRPSWAPITELALILIMGIFISFVLPKLKATPGAIVSAVFLAVLITAGTYLFAAAGQWLKVSYPAFLLAAGYTIIVSKRFLVTEKKKEQVEGESIETNKMLGLSFQGQGMLDLAFEKFRKCPMDDGMKELLYNLGLDFERKRQFNKAVAVYEHVASKDKNYKDTAQKIENLKKAAQGYVTGPVGKNKDATVVVEGSSIKPTLGRYEVEKELGKGAMGIVYLGKDPKINRQVAIKTMRFEEDADEATMKAIKERFFREAESAGNLNHPNIIKIYDAGEEQEIAYIAMELLDGHDLKKYTAKTDLLPVKTVAEYVCLTADALGYAHKQGVVHRDIKPANIMLLKDGSLRVTDYGIARITASSKTSTGTVLGTPSYMSPEQIAGKKVDGRSDIFSLGVCLFEFLTGEKPWKGSEDSIGTLLFQIANDPHPDPKAIRADIPDALTVVIAKALKKNPDERYLTAYDMAKDLKAFLEGKVVAPAPSAPATPPPVAPKPAATTTPAPAPAAAKPTAGTDGMRDKTAPAMPAVDMDKTIPLMPAKKETPANSDTDKTVKLNAAEIKPPQKEEPAQNKTIDDLEKTLPIITPPGDKKP
ncbi:MAG: CHASE2 domain-containing protein [Elusimicrobia bacterium]|nr:CHASE2 domain-containing protein [Elusimicrobiota bacterium]